MKTILATVILSLLTAANVQAAGTIGVSLDALHYCATTQTGNNFSGVTPGTCPIVPPTGCPAGRALNSTVSYNYGSDQHRQADLTSANAVIGYFSMTDVLHIMPWAQGTHPTIYGMPSNGYVAMQFTTSMGMPSNQSGLLTHAETLPGPALTAAISPKCGDFTPGNAMCGPITANAGQLMAKWKLATAVGNGCPLAAGAVYYINLKIANPALCPAPYCAVTIQANHTP